MWGDVCVCVCVCMCVCVCLLENKEGQVRSEDFGKDISSVQTLQSKHVSEEMCVMNVCPGDQCYRDTLLLLRRSLRLVWLLLSKTVLPVWEP